MVTLPARFSGTAEVPHPHRAAGMDAAPDITVRVERVTEPFSGMPLLRVTGYWEGKAPAEPSSWAVEVRYDGQTANRCELVPTTAADIPPGKVRFRSEEHTSELQ